MRKFVLTLRHSDAWVYLLVELPEREASFVKWLAPIAESEGEEYSPGIGIEPFDPEHHCIACLKEPMLCSCDTDPDDPPLKPATCYRWPGAAYEAIHGGQEKLM